MPWFPVDDQLHSHPKAAGVSLAAIGLWTLAGSWASNHLTDGDVPTHMIPSLSRGEIELADELVSVGLWRRTKAGYRFHQWHERNPTRAEVTTARKKKSAGGILGNHRRWHKDSRSDPNCPYCPSDTDPKTPHRPIGTHSLNPSEGGSARPSVPGNHRQPDQRKHQANTDRTTDRTTESVSDAGANPPLPSPTKGGTGRGITTGSTPPGVQDPPQNPQGQKPAPDPGPEPPRRCPEHADVDDTPACGRCGDARRRHATWDRARVRANAAHKSAEARARAEATRAEIAACGLCDPAGYRNGQPCAHDPDQTERVSTGAARARAALKPRTEPAA